MRKLMKQKFILGTCFNCMPGTDCKPTDPLFTTDEVPRIASGMFQLLCTRCAQSSKHKGATLRNAARAQRNDDAMKNYCWYPNSLARKIV
jgi:hypothetical protein